MKRKRRLRTYGFGNPDLSTKPQPSISPSSPMGMAMGEYTPGMANSPYYSPENLNTIAAPAQGPSKAGQWFDKNQGTIAAVGTAVGTGLEAMAKPMQDTEYTQELNKRKQLTKTIGGAASAINPLIGAGVAIGSGIGAQTVDEWGRYKSQTGNAIDEMVNPVTGVGGVMRAVKGKQSFSGFANKLTLGLAGKSDNQKEAEEGKRQFEAERVKKIKQRSQQTLANYGSTGNQYYAAYGMKFPTFPAGGMLPYPTDDSEVNQLSSNMAQYEGSTHENGGIELDTDKDQQPDIEVESQEVIKDNMVFSNRLRPSKDVKNVIRDSGVGTKKGDTYATLSARIGKKKGKFEEQMNSTRAGEKNSAQIMQGRLDETANLLFMDQQVRKFKKGNSKKFPNGGRFPKYTTAKSDATVNKLRIRPATDPIDEKAKLILNSDFSANQKQMMINNLNKQAGREVITRTDNPNFTPSVPNYKRKYGERDPYDAMPEFPNGGNVPPKRKGTGFTAPVGNKDAFKRDALGKNRAILEKDKTLKTLDIGRVDFDDWNQRGADNPDNPLNDPNLLSVDRKQILDRFRTDNKLFATTFARFDPGNSPEQQKLKGSWMDNDIYMDAPPKPLPEVANTPPPTLKLDPAFVQPQLYQYKSWEDKPKKPYGGYTGDPIPRRRGRTVQATNVTPPPVFLPAVNTPVIPNAPIAPYSTPDFQQPAPVPSRFSVEDETRRLEALKTTPTYPKGGLIGPVQTPPVDPRTMYGKYDPAVSPQSQIPLVRSNRRKAIGMQTAILDNKIDPSTMHPDTRFVTDSTANASQNFLMKHDPDYVDAMKDVRRGPLLPIQRYGGYTKRLHNMNDAMKKRAFGGYLPPFGDGDRFPEYKYREGREATSYIDPLASPFKPISVGTPAGLTGQMPNLLQGRAKRMAAQSGGIQQRGFDIGDYKGDIAAGIGTIANQIQIGKLETEFSPETIAAPRNPYTDQREYLTNQANKQFMAASQGIAGSSSQDNLALRSNMYAKSLDNLSQSMGQEQQREDLFGLRHADTKNRTDAMNVQIRNQAKQLSMENRNQKRALTQANIDNLIKSYQGNEAVRGFTQTEHGKNLLAAIQSGDRGTSERLIASLSPKMRRQLGFEAEGGIFKKGGIYIKPKNRGKFNALKKRTGKTTAELKHSKNPLTRKRATFAANAKKWKHKGRKKS